VAPTLAGLADLDVTVIAAGIQDPSALGVDIPQNATVEAFVPFRLLMPYVDAYVTNGGFGGVMSALSQGVPIVSGGTTEDKPEIGNRVAYSGAGINLRTATPAPAQVRAAVQSVLREPRYRQAAQRIQAELAMLDGPGRGADLLEQLAQMRQPILREPAAPVTTLA
jgi:UDP:flavonoid glycosyltransferase YjiC (YdhE family)